MLEFADYFLLLLSACTRNGPELFYGLGLHRGQGVRPGDALLLPPEPTRLSKLRSVSQAAAGELVLKNFTRPPVRIPFDPYSPPSWGGEQLSPAGGDRSASPSFTMKLVRRRAAPGHF